MICILETEQASEIRPLPSPSGMPEQKREVEVLASSCSCSCEGMHLLLCPCLTRAKRPISFSPGRSMSSRSASKPTAPTGERMRHPSKQPFPAPPVSARPQDHVIPSGPWTINHRRHSIRSPQNTNPEANKSAQTSNCIACYTASSSSY